MTDWPDLSLTKFVSGRAATDTDAEAGAAVFVMNDDRGTPLGEPIDIQIPQYAYFEDEDTPRSRCVLIQAERGQGEEFYGIRLIGEDQFCVASRESLKFLGDNPVEDLKKPEV